MCIDKEVQIMEETKKSIRRFEEEPKDNAPTPGSGWRKTETEIVTLKDIYQKLENKLQ